MQPFDKKQLELLEARITNLEYVLIDCKERIQENNTILEKILSRILSIQQIDSNTLE